MSSAASSTDRTLIFVTQAIDASHPILGFVPEWIRALQAHFNVVVIANETGDVPDDLRSCVTSLGKERGRGSLVRGIAYLRLVWKLCASLRPIALLAHMSPIYLLLAAPIIRSWRVRGALWFAHPSDSIKLRLAILTSNAVISSLPGACPVSSKKVHYIGQAIDTDRFFFLPPDLHGPPRLLAVGRTSPSKGFLTMVKAVQMLRDQNHPMHLRIVGPALTNAERRHRTELIAFVRAAELEDCVAITEGVARAQLVDVIHSCTFLLNGMRSGTADKVIFEAMASGRLPVVSNPVVQPMLDRLGLPLRYQEGDHIDLAQKVMTLVSADRQELMSASETARVLVLDEHSLEHWAASVHGVLKS